jgi:hypothetical protein
MKIRRLFRSRRACKNSVRRPTKAKARPAPLGIETLEDRTVPDAVPSFPIPTSTLLAASLNAAANGSLNGNSSISPLANSAVFDLGALASNLAMEATFLSNFAGGQSVPPIFGSNPSLQLDFAFALFTQMLNSMGGVGSDVASNLGSTFGAGMNFSSGNS